MNFSSLSSNEKLGLYGSVAVIVGMLIASSGFFGFGLGILALLAAIAMLVVIFLPQMSSGTSLPGSKGTLMLACGIIAAAVLVITLIPTLPFIGIYLSNINGIFFLIAVLGSLAMAWAGWQELQREGGSFRFGTDGSSAGGSASRPDAAPRPAAAPPPAAEPPPASSWSSSSEPASGRSTSSGAGGAEGAPSTGSGMGSSGSGSSGMGSTSPQPGGMGSSEPASGSGSTSAGSTDMRSEGGGGSTRRPEDDEGTPRNP